MSEFVGRVRVRTDDQLRSISLGIFLMTGGINIQLEHKTTVVLDGIVCNEYVVRVDEIENLDLVRKVLDQMCEITDSYLYPADTGN